MMGQFTRFLGTLTLSLLFSLLFNNAGFSQCFQTPPVTESFDGSTMPPTCWENQVVAGDDGWETGQQSDPGYGADNTVEHTGNGGYFAFVDFSPAGSEDTTNLVSPKVDVSGMSEPPRVVYWFWSNNTDNPGDNNILALQAWDGSAWQTVNSHQQDNPNWVKATADLSAYTFNDTVQVRFRAMANQGMGSEPYYNDILLDDIQIEESPTCPVPEDLTVNPAGFGSMELSWTSNASGSEWQVEYGTSGFTQGNGDSTILTSNPGTISGLSENSSYDFYIREVCAPGDTSAWIGPVSASTPCLPTAAPFYEDFNNSPFSVGEPGDIDPCWDRNPSADGDYIWLPGDDVGTGSSGTGPDDDIPGGGNYMYTEGSDGDPGDRATLTTPFIDMSSLTLPQFKFYYHFYGVEMDSFFVSMDKGSGWTHLDTIVGEQHSSENASWTPHNSFLQNSGGDTARFRFEAIQGDGYECDYSIDSVMVQEAPSCPVPTDLSVNSVDFTSVELGWTSNGGASEWEVEYGTSGFAQGNGMDSVLVANNPTTISGLNENTEYDFYIREICGPGDTSAWAGPVSATTPCLPTAPFYEDFNSSPFSTGSPGGIDSCWDRDPSVDDEFLWLPEDGGTGSSNTGPGDDIPGGGNYMYTEGSDGDPGDRATLTTPFIDMSSLTLPHFKFYYHFYGVEIDSFFVAMDKGSGWTDLDTIVGEQHDAEDAAWTPYNRYLTNSTDDTARFRFEAIQGDGIECDYSIDSVMVKETPACPTPSSFEANALSYDSLELSWTSVGPGSEWEVEYGPSGFSQGNGDTVTSTSNLDTLTGLTAGEEYDFYLREVCGPGDTTDWSVSPLTVSMPCKPAYTAPFYEDFNNSPFSVGSPGSIDPCWDRNPSADGDYIWLPNDGETGSSDTGPDDDIPGGGNYMYTEGTDGSPGDRATLTTPFIDMKPLTLPQFKFYYHFYGVEIDSFFVAMDKGNGWTDLDTIVGEQHNSLSDDWTPHNSFLTNSSDDTARFRFEAVQGDDFECDYSIDSVMVKEAPSCPFPTDLSGEVLNIDSAEVFWTSNGGGSEWELEYGEAGFTPGNGTRVSSSNDSDTLSGLEPLAGNSIDIYIREICAPGDTSSWTSPLQLNLPCPPAFEARFLEDFDGQVWNAGSPGSIHQCWDRDLGDFPWEVGTGQTPSSDNGPNGDFPDHGNGNYMFTEGSDGDDGDTATLRTPWVDLTSLNDPVLRYFHYFYLNGSDYVGRFTVAVDDGSGWTEIDTIDTETHTAHDEPWTERILSLSDYAGDTVMVKFDVVSGGTYSDYAIDHVEFMDETDCPEPEDLEAVGLDTSSIELSWMSNASGTEWEVEYGPTGYTQGNGIDTVTLTGNPDTIQGLDPGTDYDFYIREVCSGGGKSAWDPHHASGFTFCPSFTADYYSGFDQTNSNRPECWNSFSHSSGRVNVVDISDRGYDPRSNPQMLEFDYPNNFEDTVIAITPAFSDLDAGDKRIRFYGKGEEGAYGELVVVGTMSDPNDFSTWNPLDTLNAGGTWPQGSQWGEEIVRFEDPGLIGSDEHIGIRHLDSAGQWELYIDDFHYEAIPEHDVGVDAIVSPQIDVGCTIGSMSIEVEVHNYSDQSHSNFDVAYTLNGGSPVVETYSQTLQPGETDTFSFSPTSAFNTPGAYDIQSYSSLSNDTTFYNDTTEHSMYVEGGSLTPNTQDQTVVPSVTTIEDSLFICGADHEVYECGKILGLTIDSLTHGDAVDELDIQLVSPEGTVLDLWMQLGGDEVMSDLTFTDTASESITNFSGDPVSGIYRPEESAGFAKFNGERLNGMWKLRIYNDDYSIYGGGEDANLESWNIRAVDPERPQPDLGPADTIICETGNLLLDPGQDPNWSYMWDDNSTSSTRPVAGRFLDTSQSTTYHVTVQDTRDTNRCINSDTIDVNVEDCTGLEDRAGAQVNFRIRPNPVSDRLLIQSDAVRERFHFTLVDLQGRTVASKRSEAGNQSELDVSDLSQGVYILKGYREDNDEELFQKKVVVE